MEIDKAIDILADAAYNHTVTFNYDFYTALTLAIDALKWEKKHRSPLPTGPALPLLHETQKGH